MERIKSEFADQFTRCLKAFYKGRLPSFAKIARDFSLRAPHLPHVSAETVRHWVRGTSLPHVSRMQVLVDWLGPEVARTFDSHARVLLSGRPVPNSNMLFTGLTQANQQSKPLDTIRDELISILCLLNDQEREAVYEIAQLLVARHGNTAFGNGHMPEQAPNSDDPVEVTPES
ncbi:MAG: hypothetical protein ACOYBW_00600 [Fluviibacter phosphoraccumulans]